MEWNGNSLLERNGIREALSESPPEWPALSWLIQGIAAWVRADPSRPAAVRQSLA